MDDPFDNDSCPACGDPMDYCPGHGPMGDPDGAAILDAHDNDDHEGCHEYAPCKQEGPDA